MANDDSSKSRSKLPDRLRLHIVEMARRSDEMIQRRNLPGSKTELSHPQRNPNERNNRLNYTRYPIINQKRECINLDLIRGNPNEGGLNLLRDHKISKEMATGNDDNNETSEDTNNNRKYVYRTFTNQTDVTNFNNECPEHLPKKFIYADVNKHSSFDSSTNVRATYVSNLKDVKRDSSLLKLRDYNKYKQTGNIKPNGAISLQRQTNDNKCEIKGNAFLSPRNQNSTSSDQRNKRIGLFSASLLAKKNRVNISSYKLTRPLIKESCDNNNEDYIVRAEQTDKIPKLERNTKSNSASPRRKHTDSKFIQNLDVKKETLRPRTCHNTANTSKFTKNSSEFDAGSSSDDELFKCSYRLPEGDGLNILPALLSDTPASVANVKTYVLESDHSAHQPKPEIVSLTAHNLRIHESINTPTNDQRPNRPHLGHPKTFYYHYNNNAPTLSNDNSLCYQSDYLDASENQRISTWIKGIDTKLTIADSNLLNSPRGNGTSGDRVNLLQSCRDAYGTAMTSVSNSVLLV